MRVPASPSNSPKSAHRSSAARFVGPRYPIGLVSDRGAGADERRGGKLRVLS
jgi:hypothetical protein